MTFYLDENNPPYTTLVDGGVTDNLGLRAIYRNLMLSGGAERLFSSQTDPAPIEHIVILVVDASTKAVTEIGKSREIPSAVDVITAVTDIQLHLFNTESNSLLKQELMGAVNAVSEVDTPIKPYFIDLSIDKIEDEGAREVINEIPTSFHLEKEQADMLIDVTKQFLRGNEKYQKLLTNIGAEMGSGVDSFVSNK